MRVYAHMHSFEEPRIMNKLQSSTFLPIVDAVTLCAESQRQPSRVFSTDLSAVKGDYPVTYLKDGDIFRRGNYRFQVIETPGHHMTHICLYDEASKIMLTGDHVLERITPNISSFMLETDELGDFLASLRKVRDYDVKLALPGHGEPFSGLARRVDELIAHHEARLTEMEDLVRAGHHDIIDITSSASWKYPNWESWAMEQKFFSLGRNARPSRACRALRDDSHDYRRRSRRILPRGIARRFRFAIHEQAWSRRFCLAAASPRAV